MEWTLVEILWFCVGAIARTNISPCHVMSAGRTEPRTRNEVLAYLGHKRRQVFLVESSRRA